jgi:phosphatidylglycerol lysyltransferase
MRVAITPRTRQMLEAGVTLLLFGAALWALNREFGQVAVVHLERELASLDPGRIALALLFTAAGYAVLTLYDVLGLRAIGHRLPYRVAAEGAFLSFAVSHNVGLGWLSAGAMRQRVYSQHGLDLGEVACLTLVSSLTFFVGAFLLAGGALVVRPQLLDPLLPLPDGLTRLVGVALVGAVFAYVAACAAWRKPVGIARWHVVLPSSPVAAAQAVLACADLALAAAALHFALPASLGLSFPIVLGVYMIALSGSVLTHVPGGLGVLEALILMALPASPRAPLLVGLILFRAIYYLLPLTVAILWMAVRGAPHIRGLARQIRCRTAPFVPLITAGGVFLCGVVLLLSGATPAIDARLHELRHMVPLPLLELSHLAGSIIGLLLVILAHALYRRYDTAWTAAVSLLVAGAFASLLKGWDWEEALLLAGCAALLVGYRDAFYRHGSLWRNLGSPAWLAIAVGVLGLSVIVGFAAYTHVAYRHDLWWQVTYHGDAPRFLRASFAAATLGLALLAGRLLHAARQPRIAAVIVPEVEAAVAESPDSNANLALIGDKRFLVSASGRAFMMYQVEGESWIAMGDPVGPQEEWVGLIWLFRDLADRNGGRPVFYEVAGAHLDLYADAGLVGHKVGEEARVDLIALDLASPAAKDLRAARRRGERDHLAFDVVPAAAVADLLPEMARVSDEWLAAKGGREKGFSLGFFDPAYLSRFDCAVVRREGRLVAFANIWDGRTTELSIDLMRHADDAPKGAMMFLFVELMLWGKAQGFSWFNLGMAPLAGLADHRLAPVWHRVGRFAYAHGESLYGFDGLRRFKQQFHPVWRSRYVACRPTPTALASALRDAARLIARPPAKRPRCPAEPAGQLVALRRRAA